MSNFARSLERDLTESEIFQIFDSLDEDKSGSLTFFEVSQKIDKYIFHPHVKAILFDAMQENDSDGNSNLTRDGNSFLIIMIQDCIF